jgi:transcriptional regulator with AAA-type ATPase domain/FMN phosphatase YigB (HAD superfamily)
MKTPEKKPPARAGRPAATVGLALVFLGGEIVLPPRRYRVGREALHVGRDGGAKSVVLAGDTQASRKHASVHYGPLGNLRVVDEGSSNGTFVNGTRVTEAVLSPGDVLTVGGSLLVVGAEPEGPDDAPNVGFAGPSAAACRLRAQLARVAPGDATVLLLGAPGSGREAAARALHALSNRAGSFVVVSCSAVPESELFGHLASAFTGAAAHSGLFRTAEGGTLFFDEIGDLPLALQPKLLRALRERAVLPVGAPSPIACDVRVVAATSRDLGAAASERAFRADLYARLAEVTLNVPSLRDRREDVLALFAHALGTGAPQLEPALAERMLLHDWPYNVRELRSLAKQLRIRAGEGPYELALVEGQLSRRDVRSVRPAAMATTASLLASEVPGREPAPERAQLEALLRRHGGVLAEVARALGCSRKQLYRWLDHHGLDAESFRRLRARSKGPLPPAAAWYTPAMTVQPPAPGADAQSLIFDADDTLWENNIYFERAFEDFLDFLAHSQLSRAEVQAAFDEIALANLKVWGYGSASFARSLRQCYAHLCERHLDEADLDRVMAFGERILRQPIELIEGVEDTLDHLAGRHDLTLMTKGHPEEQRLKIDRSGLGRYFRHAAVVAEKDPAAYRSLADQLGLDPARTWMVGNSPRSDVNAALAAGLNAVYVPHHRTWHFEMQALADGPGKLLRLERFTDLRAHFLGARPFRRRRPLTPPTPRSSPRACGRARDLRPASRAASRDTNRNTARRGLRPRARRRTRFACGRPARWSA